MQKAAVFTTLLQSRSTIAAVTTNHALGGSGGGAWNGNFGNVLVKSSIFAGNEFNDDVAGTLLIRWVQPDWNGNREYGLHCSQ